MKKIRILHLVQCAGGVDCYLRMLLSFMDKISFEQILVCSKDYKKIDYQFLVDRFIQVDMCNSLSLISDIRAIYLVRGLIKHFQPDIIYCHSSKAGGIGRLANIGTGIPLIYNPHGWAFNMKGSWSKCLVYKWIERFLALFTVKYILISNNEKLSAIRYRIANPNKMKVIFNGIDLARVNRQVQGGTVDRRYLHISDNAYIIGMVGRISAQKAPDTFIRVASVIKKKIPQAYFIIVGDGDQRDEIEQMIENEGLNGEILITGWVDNPITYANLFDQAVLLSRWEGFGLVLAEYMELEKPIVATNVDAIPDLITDYDNGLLVEVDNVEQIVCAIETIYNDHNLKRKIVKNGRMRVESFFTINRMVDEHERLFITLLDRK